MRERMICVECGRENDYAMKKYNRHYEGKGYDFYLEVEVPICNKCGEEIYDEEIEDEIVDRANARIREETNIIKKEEIISILMEYNVSQKFMSRMLGWGEITLTRYISAGYTPSKVNSDKLKSLKNPYEVQYLMSKRNEETDGEITKETAFHKLQENVNLVIGKIEQNEGKIYRVVNWFLSKSTDELPITHLALQKLLYIAQGWNKAINGKWLFEDDCEAWAHGAVYRQIYDRFKKFKYNPLPKIEKEIYLDKDEEKVLDMVFKQYFQVYTAKMLEEICHIEKPYILSRKGYDKSDRCENIISKDNIESYYNDVAKIYHITKEDMNNISIYIRDLLTKKFIYE